MASRISASSTVQIDIDPFEIDPRSVTLRELEADAPLRMLVLGDFSGQATGKMVKIDRDNFEATLRALAPRVEVALGEGQVADAELTFASLEDFEPDRLYLRSELFASLREHKGAPLYSEPEENKSHEPMQPTSEQIKRLTSPGGLLDAIVEQSAGQSGGSAAAPAAKRTDEFQSMVQRIVAPYTTPAESTESQLAAQERVQRLGLLMNYILHDEQFQALESAWRGLDFLVRGLDTDERIHLYVLDVSKQELAAELSRAKDIRTTGIYRRLVDGSAQWNLLAGNFSFDRESVADVEMLARVGALAQALGAPFIGEWQTSPNEDGNAESAWQALRRSSSARYVALALPRFLLRLPYGRDTIPADGFEFEEMPGEPVHNHYLWGNPAFACALALGQLFEEQGTTERVPGFLRLHGMPLHTFRLNGETVTRPCTEMLLSDSDFESLLDEGVLPLVAVKSEDSIAFPRMMSIAEPKAGLAGC